MQPRAPAFLLRDSYFVNLILAHSREKKSFGCIIMSYGKSSSVKFQYFSLANLTRKKICWPFPDGRAKKKKTKIALWWKVFFLFGVSIFVEWRGESEKGEKFSIFIGLSAGWGRRKAKRQKIHSSVFLVRDGKKNNNFKMNSHIASFDPRHVA